MLFSLYLALTVFGVLITAADMVMLAGSHEGGHDSDSSGHGHVEADSSLEVHSDFLVESASGHSDGSDSMHSPDAQDLGGTDHADGHDLDQSHPVSLAGLDKKNRFNPVLKLMQFFRMAVYFSLGFGPVGLFSVLTGMSPFISLIYSIPTGAIALAGALGLRKILGRELNSQIEESSLIFSPAQVIVPIFEGQIGKVRIKAGGAYVDRFAKAADDKTSYAAGMTVIVTDTTGDTLIVESE